MLIKCLCSLVPSPLSSFLSLIVWYRKLGRIWEWEYCHKHVTANILSLHSERGAQQCMCGISSHLIHRWVEDFRVICPCDVQEPSCPSDISPYSLVNGKPVCGEDIMAILHLQYISVSQGIQSTYRVTIIYTSNIFKASHGIFLNV